MSLIDTIKAKLDLSSPENLEKLGNVLLISPQQRVFPKLEDLSEATGLSREQRDLIKDEARNKISEELKSAKIDSDIWQRCLYWYNIWYNNDESVIFPWNNVFEYKYISIFVCILPVLICQYKTAYIYFAGSFSSFLYNRLYF